jgi:hypothetical protein
MQGTNDSKAYAFRAEAGVRRPLEFPSFAALSMEEKAVAFANSGVQWGIMDGENGA